MATQSKLEAKVVDINKLINHQFTKEELSEKLRKQGALDEKKNILREYDIQRDLQFARANGNEDETERLQKELDDIRNPHLSWGTSLAKPAAEKQLSEAERVHQINLRNQKLNHDNVRRAQLEERKAARKAAAAVARGEAAVDPFMRVRTVAKTHHDVNTKPGDAPKPFESTPTDTPKDSPKLGAESALDAPKPSLTPKKKTGFMISYRNNDDENIAALDMDIDIDI